MAADDARTDVTRRIGWWDMFLHPDADPRIDGGFVGERHTLVGYLRNQRLTLELKCSGLDVEGLARRSVEPSNLSLLGLLRHLAVAEHDWFWIQMAGRGGSRLYRSGVSPNADFDDAVADQAMVDEAWATWRAEVAFAEQFVEAAPSLDMVGPEGDILRSVLVHMIEEYARHNGHADFLRERIDGRVGQ